MSNVRIKDLPFNATPNKSMLLATDLATAQSSTLEALVLTGRPTASQAEAEAGTEPKKAMTPLTVMQSLAKNAASKTQGDRADARFASFTSVTDAPYSAVGDFNPVSKTGTNNNAAFAAAAAAASGLWIPPGNFLISNFAVLVAYQQQSGAGPGVVWYTDGTTFYPVGKRWKAGSANPFTTAGYLSPGGILLGGEGPGKDGILLFSQGNAYAIAQPTKAGSSMEFQIYNMNPSIPAVSVVGTNYIDAKAGYTFSSLIEQGDIGGYNGVLVQVKTIVSSTRIELQYANGSAMPVFTSADKRTFRHTYTYADGTCDVSGTTVTRRTGDFFVGSGSPYGQQFISLSGGGRVAIDHTVSGNSLVLVASGGTLTNVQFHQKVLPSAYNTSLLRLQGGLATSDEENFAIWQTVLNETIFQNGYAGDGEIGPMKFRTKNASDLAASPDALVIDADGNSYFNAVPAYTFPKKAKVTVSGHGTNAQGGTTEDTIIQRWFSDFAGGNIRYLDIVARNEFSPPYLQARQAGDGTGLLRLNPNGGGLAFGTFGAVPSGVDFDFGGVPGPHADNTYNFGTAAYRWLKGFFRTLRVDNLPVYADNTAATTGGLSVGDFYRTTTGQVMARF